MIYTLTYIYILIGQHLKIPDFHGPKIPVATAPILFTSSVVNSPRAVATGDDCIASRKMEALLGTYRKIMENPL